MKKPNLNNFKKKFIEKDNTMKLNDMKKVYNYSTHPKEIEN